MSIGRYEWIKKMLGGGAGGECMCTYSEISFSAKKERNSAIYDNMMN